MPERAGRRRRFAPDIRLVIGLALVVGSVAAVVGIVGAADARTVVYAASGPLSPGDRIGAADLVERSVTLDGADRLYLDRAAIPGDGLIVIQAIGGGELVPVSAVGSTAGLDATAIVIESQSPVSAAVAPGGTVEVWASPALDGVEQQGAFGPPAVLIPDAIVVRVLDDDGLVGASDGVSVEVLVPRDRIARLLQAIANDDALAIVPAGLPLEG